MLFRSQRMKKVNYTLPRLSWWKLPPFEWRDPYHWMVTLSWPLFFLWVGLLYIMVNAVFAAFYLLDRHSILNAHPGNFWDAFFFSLQTISTVGYGTFSPANFYAQVIMAIETWVGLLGLALVTGLMFARFSLPTARILFSEVALMSTFNGQLTFMFRVANKRANRILEAQIRVKIGRAHV